jgi:hypothetical protein
MGLHGWRIGGVEAGSKQSFFEKKTKKLLFSGLFTPAWEHGYTALGAGVVING